MKYLVQDIMPCWYELSWKDNVVNPAIIVKIHKDLEEKFEEILSTALMFESLMKEFKFKFFQGTLGQSFGYENSFKKQLDQNEFACFSVDLPKVKKEETVACGMCHGSGEGWIAGEECLHCEGKGREHKIDWHDAFAVSASFTVLFKAIFYNELETSAKVPQLLTVQTMTKADMHGGSLNGMYSIPLVRWLGTIAKRQIEEMITAMTRAYNFMCESSPNDNRFYARVESSDGWLNVSCPGDACGLNPSHGSLQGRVGRGYQFSCHNVDSPLQQLTLLAGLAALHDKARREITG